MKEQFTVKATEVDAIKKKIKKWQNKAKALECEIPTITISEGAETHPSKADHRGLVALVPMVDITIEGEAPHLDEWQVIAKLSHKKYDDHHENIVTFIECDKEMPQTVRQFMSDIAPACDHCEINRYRKTTFLLKHKDSDEVIQIGSTCVEDFTRGASLKAMELYFNVIEFTRSHSKTSLKEIEHECAYMPLKNFFNLVLNVIDKRGFVSKREAEEQITRSTLSIISSLLLEEEHEILSAEHKDTEAMIDKVEEASFKDSQFAINLSNALSRTPDFININNQFAMSIIIGAIGAEIKKEKYKANERQFAHEHAGIVGQRSTFRLTLIGDTYKETDYNTAHIFFFVDSNQRKFKWTCWGKEPDLEMSKNRTYDVTATISKHENFGTLTTVINRCKDFRLITDEPEAN